jgi:hypothetical protein
MAAQSMKWVCPVCSHGALFKDLVVDQYLERILADPSAAGCERIEVLPSGEWRPIVSSAKRAGAFPFLCVCVCVCVCAAPCVVPC